MIKGIMGDSNIVVAGGNTPVPYVSTNPDNPMQGMIRVYGTDVQVYNGSSWVNMNTSYATVSLGQRAQEAVEWAQHKMQEERELELIKARYPQLAGAIEEVEQAKKALGTLIALTKEYE